MPLAGEKTVDHGRTVGSLRLLRQLSRLHPELRVLQPRGGRCGRQPAAARVHRRSERAAEHPLHVRLCLRNVRLETLQHGLGLTVCLPAKDHQRCEQAIGLFVSGLPG